MSSTIVVGAGFGDEGKGQTVSNLIKEKSPGLVVRFNGGHQAGHTVVYDGIRHVFSNFGSGTLQGVPTYWSNYCTIDLYGMKKEYDKLISLGVTPRLYIDPMALVTLPLDKQANITNESFNDHGTVGVGFGDTIERNEFFYKLYAMDLQFPFVLKNKLDLIINNYFHGRDYSWVSEFLDLVDWLNDTPNITIAFPEELIEKDLIFEGAQGLLLDQDFGFFPHVTRSKCSPINALSILKDICRLNAVQVLYVTRAYHTRHGNGPLSDEYEDLNLIPDLIETNQTNQFQGKFRKAPLNIDLLAYAITMSRRENLNHFFKVNITCLGHFATDNVPIILSEKLIHVTKHELLKLIKSIFGEAIESIWKD